RLGGRLRRHRPGRRRPHRPHYRAPAGARDRRGGGPHAGGPARRRGGGSAGAARARASGATHHRRSAWSRMSAVAEAPGGVADSAELVRSGTQDAWRQLKKDRLALASGLFLILVVLAAIFGAPLAEHLTGHPQNKQYVSAISADGVPLGPW